MKGAWIGESSKMNNLIYSTGGRGGSHWGGHRKLYIDFIVFRLRTKYTLHFN